MHRALLVAVAGLVLSACSAPTTSGEHAAPASSAAACLVTDEGGLSDEPVPLLEPLNGSAVAGLVWAQRDLDVATRTFVPETLGQYPAVIADAVASGCEVVITSGYWMADVTEKFASDLPWQRFAIVNWAYPRTHDNLRELTFAAHEGAFIAGYLAAGTSETGKVATVGAQLRDEVAPYLYGFAAGVAHFNEVHSQKVELVGWSPERPEERLLGSFENHPDAVRWADEYAAAGVDVLLPVAGAAGAWVADHVQREQLDMRLVWPDSNGCVRLPDHCDVLLASVVKRADVAVFATTLDAVSGGPAGGVWVGDLSNRGIELTVHAGIGSVLADELEALRGQIVTGTLEVPGPPYTTELPAPQ